MKEDFYQIWMVVKWFFTDFCLQLATAPLGILKDTIDTIGLSWKIVCLLGSILLLAEPVVHGLEQGPDYTIDGVGPCEEEPGEGEDKGESHTGLLSQLAGAGKRQGSQESPGAGEPCG